MTALVVAAVGHLLYNVIGFVIWVLVMVWIYNIAKRKGRHPLGWVILGFFFSLIALLVVALLPSKLTTERYRS
jgi:RsiW-degrading membrane proteinase PrsW (M82 family)